MSQIERKAAGAGTPTATTNSQIRRTGVSSKELCEIPASWGGNFVDFDFYDTAATTNVCAIRFGTDSSVDVDLTTATGKSSNAFTATVVLEPHIVLGHLGSKSRYISSAWTHFAFICTAATGKLCAVLTTTGEE